MMNEILLQLILFASNTIQTITGFAGTLIAMPFSIHVIGVQNAKAVLTIFTMLACGVIAFQNRKSINKKVLFHMIVGMLIGMGIGVYLFEILPTKRLLIGYAWLVILVALKKMFWKKEIRLPSIFQIFVLLVAGVIHGMFLSGGALLVVYAVNVLKNKEEFRATISPVWVILNAILAIVYFRQGYYTVSVNRMVACSIIALIASVVLGNYLFKKVDQSLFLKITYILLLISGASLLI